jgi:autotransporter translocation and assembly factor TamB
MKILRITMISGLALALLILVVFFMIYRNRFDIIKRYALPRIQKELGVQVEVKDIQGDIIRNVELNDFEINQVVKTPRVKLEYDLKELRKQKRIKKISMDSLRLLNLERHGLTFVDFTAVPGSWDSTKKDFQINTRLLASGKDFAEISGNVSVKNRQSLDFRDLDVRLKNGNLRLSGHAAPDSTRFSSLSFQLPEGSGSGKGKIQRRGSSIFYDFSLLLEDVDIAMLTQGKMRGRINGPYRMHGESKNLKDLFAKMFNRPLQ